MILSASIGLVVGSAMLLVSPLLGDDLRGDGASLAGGLALAAGVVAPFLLALVSLWLAPPHVRRAIWLGCGLVAFVPGVLLLFSGVGIFLAAASTGLVMAWWLGHPKRNGI